jgi:hypothetical protein
MRTSRSLTRISLCTLSAKNTSKFQRESLSLKDLLTKFPKHFTASDQYENTSITYLCQLAVSHTTCAKSSVAQWNTPSGRIHFHSLWLRNWT